MLQTVAQDLKRNNANATAAQMRVVETGVDSFNKLLRG